MRLMTFKEASDYLGFSDNKLHVQHSKNRNTHWVVKGGDILLVDIDAYMKQRNIVNKCYGFNTNELYWYLQQIYKTNTLMAQWLAKKSNIYKEVSSWQTFLSIMFAIPLVNGVELKANMHSEFYCLSILIIGDYIKGRFKFESYS